MSPTEIRQATAADLKELAVLFDQYRCFYGQTSNPVAAGNFLKERMQGEESVIFVAITGSVFTGFVQLYPIFSSVRMQRMWLLNDLFVSTDYRGQGISRLLIGRSKELCVATGACGLLLETARDNVPGNHLYPAEKFVLQESQNFYFWQA